MHQLEVSRAINASPQRLYELVGDLPRMGEWSPENSGGKWLKGATGPAVGARFKGKNRKGWRRWSTLAKVVVAEPDREFAFDVSAKGVKVAGWGYRLDSSTDSSGTEVTTVTEYWNDHRSPFFRKLTGLAIGVPDRTSHNRAGMEQTLERLAAATAS